MVSALRINTGIKVSGAAHVALILWMFLGGLFSFDRPSMDFTDVTVISGDQFDAMMAARSNVPDVVDEPAPTLQSPTQEAPEPQEVPDPVPDVVEEASPAEEVVEQPQDVAPIVEPALPDEPLTPESGTIVAPENPPAPIDAPRVAPEPAVRPEPDVVEAPDVQEAVRPDESAAAETPVEVQEATAPEEATTEIVTEATEVTGGSAVALAPATTRRPPRRPEIPERVSAPDEPTPAVELDQSTEPDPDDAIAAAVAEAVASTAPASVGNGTAPSGPPMTSGERDALRLGVERCWNVGSLSTDALGTTVVLYVQMHENGKPDNGSISMVDFSGGSEIAARQAFEAARRAVIRCGATGFDLPLEKYSHWREIEMVFNPEKMRIK